MSGRGVVAWFVGRVVVLQQDSGKQRFYTSHADDVACLAKLEPIDSHVAGGPDAEEEEAAADGDEESPPLILASAAVGPTGDVHVWDSDSLDRLAALSHGFPVRHMSLSPHDCASLATIGGRDGASTLTVWDWRGERHLVERHCQDNVPFADVKCNPFFDVQSGEQDQVWAVTCGPRGVTFWILHEPAKEGAQYKLSAELGGLHHVSDHSEDLMALCAHFVSSSVLVTGMADGDIVTWRGMGSVSRVRLAHPGGVFDISGNMTTMLSGGKDCVLRVWDVSAFKGSSLPQSRMIRCRGMLQDRAACVRSVCIGTGG